MSHVVPEDSEPPHKRQRTEDDQPASGPTDLIHHPEFWLSDGNIVLRAGDTVFRVYRGWLARHSDVFGSMLTLPQPSQCEMYDGCPLVELQDTAEDLGYFIKALFDTRFFQPGERIDFVVVAGILRLSTKYLVDHLRRRAISQLMHHYPSTLENYDAIQATNEQYMEDGVLPHPLHVVNLAHECAVPIILPAAFYMCCTRFSETLLGSKLAGTSSIAYLSPQDQRVCFEARQFWTIIAMSAWHRSRIPSDGDLICKDPHCRKAKVDDREKVASSFMAHPKSTDILQILHEPLPPTLCGSCRQIFEKHHSNTRLGAWDLLPSRFVLGSWDALRTEMSVTTAGET